MSIVMMVIVFTERGALEGLKSRWLSVGLLPGEDGRRCCMFSFN